MSDSNDTELVVSSDDESGDEEANVVGLLRDRTGLIYHRLPEDLYDHFDDLVGEEGRSDSGIYAQFTPFRYEDELQRRDVFGIKLRFGSDVTGEQTNERVVQRLDTRYGVVRYPYDLAYMTDLHTRAEDVSTEEPATSQPANDGTVEASEEATAMVMPGDRLSDTDPKTRVSFEQVDEQTLAVRFDPPLNVWKPDAGFQPHPDIEPARVNLQRIPVEEERRSDTGETLGDIGKWRLILPIEYRDGYDLTASRRANKTDGTPVELALTVDSKTDTPAIVHNPDPATDHEGRLRTVGQSTGGRPEDDVAVDQHHIHVSKALVNGLGLGTTYEGSRSVALIPYESCFTLVPTSGPYAFTGSL